MLPVTYQSESKANAVPASSTSCSIQMQSWPVPSSKEWASICTVAIRVVVVLGWLHGRIVATFEEEESTVADMPTDPEQNRQCPWQLLLMQALLQLLERLLSGKPLVLQALPLLSTYAGVQS